MDITVLKLLMPYTYPLTTRVHVRTCLLFIVIVIVINFLPIYSLTYLLTTYTYNVLEARIELTRQYRIGQKKGDER